MSEKCKNCGAKIATSGFFVNEAFDEKKIARINLGLQKNQIGGCEKCSSELLDEAGNRLRAEAVQLRSTLEKDFSGIPIFTVDVPPPGSKYYLLGMVTANVTVGTGVLNEFSQGFQDILGSTSTESGMALKSNRGELVARKIMAENAVKLGANAILGADIDYGITGNNSAVINMQGTAAFFEDLDQVLPSGARGQLAGAEALKARLRKIEEVL